MDQNNMPGPDDMIGAVSLRLGVKVPRNRPIRGRLAVLLWRMACKLGLEPFAEPGPTLMTRFGDVPQELQDKLAIEALVRGSALPPRPESD